MAKKEISSANAYSMKKGHTETTTLAPEPVEGAEPPKRKRVEEVFHSFLYPYHLALKPSQTDAEAKALRQLREMFIDTFKMLYQRFGKDKIEKVGGINWEGKGGRFIVKVNSVREHVIQKNEGGHIAWSLVCDLDNPTDIKITSKTGHTSEIGIAHLQELVAAV